MGTADTRYAGIKDTTVRNEYRLLLDELQHDLLKLSSNSRLVKAVNSGHVPQINDRILLIAEIRRSLAMKG